MTNRPCWWYGTKEYLISAIVGTSQRGRASLSGMSQEIGCHMVASQELGTVYMSPVNRASPGHAILSSAAKGDLN